MVYHRGFKEKLDRFLEKNKSKIDLSTVDFDGSHTIAIRGREEVGYQGRKKRKTTNALYLRFTTGNFNSCGWKPYDIEAQFEVVTGTLEQANISVGGLDAGFDSKEFRLCCEKKK